MSITAVRSEVKEPCRALDPEFPFDAAEAAIYIDNLLLSKSSDLQLVRRLAVQLKNCFEAGPANGSHRALMNPGTVTSLSVALIETVASTPSEELDVLWRQGADLAHWLSSESEGDLTQNREKLIKARNLFVALSKSAMDYPEWIYDPSHSHPYQR